MPYTSLWISSDGAIATVSTQPEYIIPAQDGVSSATHYFDWDLMEIAEKSDLGDVFSPPGNITVPTPCQAVLQGPIETLFEVPYGVSTLAFDAPGVYTLQLHPYSHAYLSKTITITVTP